MLHSVRRFCTLMALTVGLIGGGMALASTASASDTVTPKAPVAKTVDHKHHAKGYWHKPPVHKPTVKVWYVDPTCCDKHVVVKLHNWGKKAQLVKVVYVKKNGAYKVKYVVVKAKKIKKVSFGADKSGLVIVQSKYGKVLSTHWVKVPKCSKPAHEHDHKGDYEKAA